MMKQYDIADAVVNLSTSNSVKYKTPALSKTDPYYLLRQGIWGYFLLLIFEGALRKWVLPGFSPLLLIRDPLALWLLVTAWRKGVFSLNPFVTWMGVIGILGIYTAVLLGHGNLLVALYGARIFLFHFPLIFVIGAVFRRDDVVKIGKIMLWLSIPMAVLIAVQFYSPQTAWVNRSVSGDSSVGAGFSGALGYFRPPGTFSFTNGVALFFSLVASFVFYFWFYPKEINKILLIAATVALLSAIPFSISRTLFFEVCLSAFFAFIAVFRKPGYMGKMLGAVAGGIIIMIILNYTGLFQTAITAFSVRFETANESEGGLQGVLGDRYLGAMIDAITGSSDLPFFGYGLGMGTSVGASLLLGKSGLLLAEDEWARQVSELGLLMGFAVILVRLILFIKMGLAGYRRLSAGDFLPWMLLSFGLVNIPQGQWAQPTALGFGILIGGLLLASLRNDAEVNDHLKTNTSTGFTNEITFR